jgi:predicted transcriptional regulator
MKLTFLQIEQAHGRAVFGESVRSIARSMGVTEGALRFHFRKDIHPRELRRLAYELHAARQLLESLSRSERKGCEKRVARLLKASPRRPEKRGSK